MKHTKKEIERAELQGRLIDARFDVIHAAREWNKIYEGSGDGDYDKSIDAARARVRLSDLLRDLERVEREIEVFEATR